MTCPPGKTIDITFANYGRRVPYSEKCPYPHHSPSLNCYRGSDVIKSMCQGKNSCYLDSGAVWRKVGDPCPGTFKYSEMNYDCIGKILPLK